MTRRLPPAEINVHVALAQSPPVIAESIFRYAPGWMMPCALAALYRFRPDLGVEVDPLAHERHLWAWLHDGNYFGRVCRLLKAYGVGSQWGED